MTTGQGSLFSEDGSPSPEVAGTAEPVETVEVETVEVEVAVATGVLEVGGVSEAVDVAGLLAPWREAGVLGPADVHIAAALARLAGLGTGPGGPRGLDPDEAGVVLGVALAARAPRLGHVCLDLATVRRSVPAEVEGDADAVAAAAIEALPWPDDIDAWRAVLAASPLVSVVVDGVTADQPSGRGLPLVLDGTLLYLERYRVYEDRVAAELLRRAEVSAATAGAGPTVESSAFAGAFNSSPEQRAAAEAGASGLLSVVVGGPGTGKTTTVATLLALLLEAEPATRIALVAPTGKAAARMDESIIGLSASLRASGVVGAEVLAERLVAADVSTIHRRLVWRPDGTFRHGRLDPLAHDVVIVDETSMVSLPLMAHLLDAVRPDARVVLVGDPGQLASVEAGSVLGDIAGPTVDAARAGAPPPAGPLAGCVSVLARSYRFPADSTVGRFAAAVRTGDADAALATLTAEPVAGMGPLEPTTATGAGRSGSGSGSGAGGSGSGSGAGGSGSSGSGSGSGGVRLVWAAVGADTEGGEDAVRDAALDGARRTLAAALDGDAAAALAALGEVRVLCAHRRGPFGVAWWNWRFEGWLSGDGPRLDGSYVGRPVMVTANDAVNGVSNGDLGVIVAAEPSPRLALPAADGDEGFRLLAPSRLEAVDTVHAMTIHKSQGSEFDEVVVVLPADSLLATRELLYTAVTRARQVVTLVGSEAALRRAVSNRVVRQTGLRDRLWGPSTPGR